jgi:hypothetical protein
LVLIHELAFFAAFLVQNDVQVSGLVLAEGVLSDVCGIVPLVNTLEVTLRLFCPQAEVKVFVPNVVQTESLSDLVDVVVFSA